jgi:hypothetical protein
MAFDSLDIVLVAMLIEEKFGISLRDSDAMPVRTMGDLHALVLAKTRRGQEQVCVTSATFYRLRAGLIQQIGIPRGRIRPDVRMEDLIPVRERRRHWQGLGGLLGDKLRLPALRRPRWLELFLLFSSLMVIIDLPLIGAAFLSKVYSGAVCVEFWGCSVLLGTLMTVAGYRFTKPFAVRIPPGCTTVRDTVYRLVSEMEGQVASREGRPSDAETWGLLCGIVASASTECPETLSPTTPIR